MTSITVIKTIPREKFLRLMAEDQWVEILIVMKISHLLYEFAEKNNLGDVLGDGVIYILRTKWD